MGPRNCEAIDGSLLLLSRFLICGLDVDCKDRPSVDQLRFAISTMIDHNNFNKEDYEIRNLLRITESKRGVSYLELTSHLKHLVPDAVKNREAEKYYAIHGWPASGDPWSEE